MVFTVDEPLASSGLSEEEQAKLESDLSVDAPFTYDVDKETRAPDWIVTFNQASRVRHHTSPNYVPYVDDVYYPDTDELIVQEGQWLEGWIFYRGEWTWSLLSGADHR